MLTCHIAVRSCCTFVTRALFSATRLSFYKRPHFQTTLTVLNFKGKPITIPDINRSRACTDISISAISFKKLCVGEVKFFSNSTSPLARREGFEPPETLSSTVFKTAVIDHSTISANHSVTCLLYPPFLKMSMIFYPLYDFPKKNKNAELFYSAFFITPFCFRDR